MSCSSGGGGGGGGDGNVSSSGSGNSSNSRRTRGGCVNCKKRKRKCDEQRPECMACTARNMKCGGYAHPVRWVEGMASRGRFVGLPHPGILPPPVAAAAAAATTSPTPAAATSTSPSPSTATTTPPPGYSTPATIDASSTPVPSRPGVDLQQPPLATAMHGRTDGHDTISHEERAAYQKFLVDGLHRLCNAELYAWLTVFFEVTAQQSRALTLVGAALQAYLDDGWSITAMERMDRAISTFRADLGLLGTERRSATLCSGLLICTMCLYQNKPITPYLRLLADMHNLNGNLSGLLPDPRLDVPSQQVLEVLGVMDMPSFLVGRLHQSLGMWKRVRCLRSERSDLMLGLVEPVTGMPRSLLDIFADFAYPENALKEAEAQFWAWPGCKGTFDQCHLWDTWRFAGILDARRRLRRQETHVAPETSTSCATVSRPDNEAVLCRLMALLDVLIGKVRSVGGLEPALLTKALVFPFTMASLEIPLLRVNRSWKSTLREFHSAFFCSKDTGAVHETLFALLDQAWELDDASFDLDRAARELGMEIGIF